MTDTTGTPEHWTDRLSEYVDGELDPPTRVAIDAHLAICAECRATRDALTRVIARARRVPYREPSRDLWTSVEAAIDASRVTPIASAPRRRLVTLPMGRLVAAVAAVAIIAAGIAWMVASTRTAPPLAAVPDSAPATIGVPMTSPAALAVASYRDAAADLERALEAGRSTLRPETMRVIEENLRTIDRAIAQADSALRRDPGSDYLNQYLAATMQRKLRLLRRAVDITTARS
jgi:anti-sigma factor RsiW